MNAQGQPEWAWLCRSGLARSGWHVVKTLALDTGEASTFCGGDGRQIRRSLPTHGRVCRACLSAIALSASNR